MLCIVAFHRVGILCLSMVEGMDKPSRRTFLASTAALAANAAVPDKAEAGVLHWLGICPDPEKVKQLSDRFYASERYMNHNGGKLRANFARLQAIGMEMKGRGAYLGLSQPERDKELAKRKDPIYTERDAYLKDFDPELITDLLAEYIENGFTDANQELIRLFVRACGTPNHILKGGRAGLKPLDIAAIANISSVMPYSLNSNPTPHYGEVHYGPIIFRSHEAPRDR